MSDPVELWRQIHQSFKWHRVPRIDSSSQAAMDRVAMKCLGVSFNHKNCTVREESLDNASLKGLVLRHKGTRPSYPGGPIVILLYKGKKYVIDGNNRVNVWIKQKISGPFRAIVVEPNVR